MAEISAVEIASASVVPGPCSVFADVVASASEAAEPVAVFDAVVASASDVAEPAVFVDDIAELQASADIAFVVEFLDPVFADVAWADSSVHPRFLAVPNNDCFSSFSSFVEVFGSGCVGNSTGARTNRGLYSISSKPDLHQNKKLGHCHNNPSRGYNNVNDTSDLPRNATTSHSRNTSLHLYQAQHRHSWCQVSQSHPEEPEIG